MKPYSLDLRRRVLGAWQRGEGSQRQLASRFSVHLTFVRNLLRLYRQSDSIEPRPHGGGRRSLAEGPVLERLAQNGGRAARRHAGRTPGALGGRGRPGLEPRGALAGLSITVVDHGFWGRSRHIPRQNRRKSRIFRLLFAEN